MVSSCPIERIDDPDLTSKDKLALLAEVQDPPGFLQVQSITDVEQLEPLGSLDVVLIQPVVQRDGRRLAQLGNGSVNLLGRRMLSSR